MNAEAAIKRYRLALGSIPAPGTGCHPALLGVANHGAMAGVARERMVREIFGAIPAGKRPVAVQEVEEAVDQALLDAGPRDSRTHRPSPHSTGARRVVIDRDRYFRIAKEHVSKRCELDDYEAELREESTVRMDWEPKNDPAMFMKHLYSPDDLVFIGGQHSRGMLGETIRPAVEWQRYFERGDRAAPHIIANPLTGRPGRTKGGKLTLRGDSCVKSFRFAVVEFDDIPKSEQAAFFLYAKLPISAIIDSGGKSLHGWVRVDARDADTWTRHVERNLFDRLLRPLGVDSACKNESRMSRLPGHLRDTGNRQRLLFLAPGGKVMAA